MRPGTVSVLTPEQDELITRIIGCAIRVHKELGPGFLERIYATALGFELDAEGIPFKREVPMVVNYRSVLPIDGTTDRLRSGWVSDPGDLRVLSG